MKIKGVIFDLDGTLLDSTHIWENVGPDYVKKRGFVPEPDLSKKILGKSLVQATTYIKEQYQLPEDIETLMSHVNDMVEEAYVRHIGTKEGVEAVLCDLSRRGVPMCVATLTDRYLVETVFNRLGLLSYFKDIITANEVGSGKDQPYIYMKAAECLGTKIEETLVAEDMLYTVQTAKCGGFPVLAIYDKAADNVKDKMLQVADFYLNSWLEWDFDALTVTGTNQGK